MKSKGRKTIQFILASLLTLALIFAFAQPWTRDRLNEGVELLEILAQATQNIIEKPSIWLELLSHHPVRAPKAPDREFIRYAP